MTRKLRLLLSLLALVLSLAACNSGDIPVEHTAQECVSDTTTTVPESTQGIALTGDIAYTIIRSETAGEKEIELCSALWKKIFTLTGSSIVNINDDFAINAADVNNTRAEVLIGLTNRPASTKCLAELQTYLDWSIMVVGEKIVISANTNERLSEAVDYFCSALEVNDGVVYYTGGNHVDSYDGYKYKNLSLCGRSISEYVITLGANAAELEQEFAEYLAQWFAENTGYRPAIADGALPADAAAISITGGRDGETVLNSGDYILRTVDGSVSFAAGSIAGYNKAMEKMLEKISDGALASGIDEEYSAAGVCLDGKKVAFIGNSFLYYGGCVELGNQRSADNGVFWQICSANGENVTVYDFTYGGHRLRDFTEAGDKTGGSGSPGIGQDLLADVDLADVDIVFISEAGENNANFLSDVKSIMNRFTKPGVQFVYVTHAYTYLKNHTNIINALPKLRAWGVLIADWGKLVYDLIRHTVQVENSSFAYTQTTFIKNKGDSHHPNPLAGYITAQMCYSVVTGRQAVGQSYAFCRDRQFGGDAYGFDEFISKHYHSAEDTNFVRIFASPAEMAGLQRLMDEYVNNSK